MKKAIALLLILLLAGCQTINSTTSAAPAATEAVSSTAELTAESAPAATEAVSPTAEPTAEPAPAADETIEYAFSFTAKTLDGEEVTEAFFGQYDLTMVNVWASWCPPCRGELAELGELYGKLPENVGFLSVTVDDPGDLKDAKALLEQNNCTFPCLDGQASAGLTKNLLGRVMAIPTTVFFDRAGNEAGEWIVGVPQGKGSVADAYLANIQARLDLLNGK